MGSTIPMMTLVARYSWILIFTTLCSVKPEFRATSDVQDAWIKYSKRVLLDPFFHC